MNRELVSVIVPVYNTEKYLKKCIDSILNQTYKDIELILVDDGSTDKSLEILREYEKQDNRVVVITQENKGVSEARNTGLEAATGRYIGFFDSDDYISLNMIEHLVGILEDGYDFASCGWLYETEEGKTEQSTSGSIKVLETRNDILTCMFEQGGCAPNVCNKLLRGDIIKQHGIRFPKGIKIGEDMIMLCEYVLNCGKGFYDPNPLYHYVTRKDSAYHKRIVKGSFDESFVNEIKAHEIVLKMLPEGRARKRFINKMYYVSLRTMMFLAYAGFPDQELQDSLIRFLRENLTAYLSSDRGLKQKIHALLMCASPRLWQYVFKYRG
ncbi:MAG: glycosyltransferase [Clostridiaceae bacterium]|nr:glycosyltransferase [Clostridiaceae bacterium]